MTMQQFTCDDIQAVLSGLLDGELDVESRHRAEVHLVQCDACRAKVDRAEALDAQVRAATEGREHWSDDLERSIRAAAINDPLAEHRALRRLRVSAWTGWVTSLAAMILIALLLAVQFRSGPVVSGSDDRTDGTMARSDTNGPAVSDESNRIDDVAMGVLSPDQTGGLNAVAGDGSNEVVDDSPASDASANDPVRYAANESTAEDDEEEEFDSVPVIDVVGEYESISSSLVSFALPNVIADAGLEDAPAGSSVDRNENEVEQLEDVAPPLEIRPNQLAAADAVEDNAIGGEVGDAESARPLPEQYAADVTTSGQSADEASADSSPSAIEDDWRFQTDDVLYSSSILLRLLENAEDTTFADVRQINEVLDFDDVLDRLAASRDELEGDEAEIVDRAWAALEWVNGPMDQQHLRRVQQMINEEQLADQLEALSNKYATY